MKSYNNGNVDTRRPDARGAGIVSPELLSPAGSPDALCAAIEGGADAVYFGAAKHNARIGAVNFSEEDVKKYTDLAHIYGVKTYMTLNTLAYDRELDEVLSDAYLAYDSGVDALIVADMGIAAAVHRYLPDMPLHASTQVSGHNVEAAVRLQKMGFSRMVLARETPYEDIKYFTDNSPIEAEVFIHGALCVCHSGQCLFSSVVGGRSGNRGECAQPCRLPYKVHGADKYPLSLKDLSLSRHIEELIDARVASLKIEGRMKSPEYVLAVTKVFRKLLDEGRNATDDEVAYLASIFSRGGFTDGYFTKKINSSMLGVRSEADKASTRTLPPFDGIEKKISVDLEADIRHGKAMSLSLTCLGEGVTCKGDVPEEAINTPTAKEKVVENLTKFGGTPFTVGNIDVKLAPGLAVRVSQLNAMRRECVALITEKLTDTHRSHEEKGNYRPILPDGKRQRQITAQFLKSENITDAAREYFDIIYLPPEEYDGSVNGVILPEVIFDSERDKVKQMLISAKEKGAVHALVGNYGHIDLALEAGLIPHGSLRFNVTNSEACRVLEENGISDVILSPELTLPQIRDIRGNTSVVVYGRLPLMLLEKCLGKDIADCNVCTSGKLTLTDRMGKKFPVLRQYPHRCVIYNCVPTVMSDREKDLSAAGVVAKHFIFSTENASEVTKIVEAYKYFSALGGDVRRIR